MMNKYRQYRMMKKVEKLLNAPVRKESYDPSGNVYISNKSLSTEDNTHDPNRKLRIIQVEAIARLLLQQMSQLEVLYAGSHSNVDIASKHESGKTFTEIDILFEELDEGVLLTETEKATRRFEKKTPIVMTSLAEDYATTNLAALSKQVQDWQQEHIRRKKRLHRVESSIRELSLNVHDTRCNQILCDRKTSAAALDSNIDLGILLLKGVFTEVQNVCATIEPISGGL